MHYHNCKYEMGIWLSDVLKDNMAINTKFGRSSLIQEGARRKKNGSKNPKA